MRAKITLWSIVLSSATWLVAQTAEPKRDQPSSSTGQTITTPSATSSGTSQSPSSTNPSAAGTEPSTTGTGTETTPQNPGGPPSTAMTTQSPDTTPQAGGQTGEQTNTNSQGATGATNPSGSMSNQNASGVLNGAADHANSISGCLSGSAAAGTYTLTSHNGQVYTLNGSLDKLRTHIGEQIQVTGQVGSANSPATPGSPSVGASASVDNHSAGNGNPTGSVGVRSSAAPTNANAYTPFQATDVTKIADHCTQNGRPSASRHPDRGEALMATARIKSVGSASSTAGAGLSSGQTTAGSGGGTTGSSPASQTTATPSSGTSPTPGTSGTQTGTPSSGTLSPADTTPSSATNPAPGTSDTTTPGASDAESLHYDSADFNVFEPVAFNERTVDDKSQYLPTEWNAQRDYPSNAGQHASEPVTRDHNSGHNPTDEQQPDDSRHATTNRPDLDNRTATGELS